MPHVDITMFPGREQQEKRQLAVNVQHFLAQELKLEEKFLSVSIEDIPKEDWRRHMDQFSDEVLFVPPDLEFLSGLKCNVPETANEQLFPVGKKNMED